MTLKEQDKNVLRWLAARCREIAESDHNVKLQQKWRDLNDLKHDGPPMLQVSPEGCWREIGKTFPVECESELARSWEVNLRQRIFMHENVKDDTAFDPTFKVPYRFSESDFGIPFKRPHSEQEDGSFHDDPILDNLDGDLEKLHVRNIQLDRAGSEVEIEMAEEAFGDLLKIIPGGSYYWWTCGLTATAIQFTGLQDFMLYMYDDPDGVHRLMGLLRDDMLDCIDFFEREQVLAYNADSTIVGSGNLGYSSALPSFADPVDGPVMLSQLWGFSESQETVGVSPDMFEEFIFPYQLPLMEKFGLNYYGCCEAVEQRWESIKQIPNLRAVSVAPWAGQEACAGLMGRDYVYCRKPNPSPVCMGFNEAAIRKEFQDTLQVAGNLNTMMVLKDTHTIENDIDRLARWVQLGREEMVSHYAW
jgi:hypothetical protein